MQRAVVLKKMQFERGEKILKNMHMVLQFGLKIHVGKKLGDLYLTMILYTLRSPHYQAAIEVRPFSVDKKLKVM